MKKIVLAVLFLAMPNLVFASAPTRAYTYVANTTIDPNQNNTNENALYSYLQAGVDTYSSGSITGDAISASAAIPYSKLNLLSSLKSTDIASGQGVLLPTGAIFFMLTGSCPTGTTDITATYSNKFIKVNSTQGTTSAGVFTATTDGTAITQANLPLYNLQATRYDANGSGLTGLQGTTNGATAQTQNISSGGSGTAHTHTVSSATTNEPASVTAKLCQVN